MSFEVGDVVQYVWASQIAVVVCVQNPFIIGVRRSDGGKERWVVSTVLHYCEQHKFQRGEQVVRMHDKKAGVIGGAAEPLRGMDYVCVDFEDGSRVSVVAKQLVHKTAMMIYHNTSEEMVEEKQCPKCGGTGEVVLFQLPVKCECVE